MPFCFNVDIDHGFENIYISNEDRNQEGRVILQRCPRGITRHHKLLFLISIPDPFIGREKQSGISFPYITLANMSSAGLHQINPKGASENLE